MNPSRVDFLIDVAYGLLIFVSIVLIVAVGTGIGVSFGLGALVSYIIHVGWKMARFDPEWMTKEVTENIEETLTEEVTESVSEKVSEGVEEKVTQEVTETVEKRVAQEVTENVEEALSTEIESIIRQLEEVNERIDRRPRADEIQGQVATDAPGDDDRSETSGEDETG